MFKKILNFFKVLEVKMPHYTLEATMNTQEEYEQAVRQKNMETLMIANMELQREINQKNLIAQHRLMIVTFFAVLVSIPRIAEYSRTPPLTIQIQ